MSTYNFGALANGQHLAFNAGADVLRFDDASIAGSAVTLLSSGTDLGFAYGGKTIWLDATDSARLSASNLVFANGSVLLAGDGTINTLADWYGRDYTNLATSPLGNQVWGLGGADLVVTGSGPDWLVGNTALTPLDHVSRLGATGDPLPSGYPTISADGRFVSFEGQAWTQFGSGGGAGAFVKDMLAGTVNDEQVTSTGATVDSTAGRPVVSADGHVIAFFSGAANLVPGVNPGTYQVYVSAVGGPAIELVSSGTGGVVTSDGGASLDPDLSADGRYVVFESQTESWFGPGAFPGAVGDNIYLKDRSTGTLARLTTSLTGGYGNNDSTDARISADGRYVVFQSLASDLTANDHSSADIFVWDRDNNGQLTNLTNFMDPALSGDDLRPDVAFDNGVGGVIVFQSVKKLVAHEADPNQQDIYAFNMSGHAFQLVSSKADGSGVHGESTDASISGDGRYVVFTSSASDLVPGDTNGFSDVFVKDIHTGAIALVSHPATGEAGNRNSVHGQISLGGDWIVFESDASNLASTDGNGIQSDVFRVSNPLLQDTLAGGAGNDTYVLARADIVQEQPNGGIDTIRSSITYSLVDTDGNGTLGGNVENLTLLGSENLDGTGNALNNVLTGNAGNNRLDGGSGIDRAVFSGHFSNYTLTKAGSTWTVRDNAGADGTDTLTNIERLQFSDDKLALDLDGNAGTTAKILGAVFGKASLTNATYVGIGLSYLDAGTSYVDLMQLALDAAGATTHASVVDLLWKNLFGSAPTAAQAAPYVDMLDTHQISTGALGVLAANLDLNLANINFVGLQQAGIHYV
jgi:Tol biopolymer transport system component